VEKNKKPPLCPFTAKPDKDCYCVNVNSNKVKNILDYCGGDFKECPVYKRLILEESLREFFSSERSESEAGERAENSLKHKV